MNELETSKPMVELIPNARLPKKLFGGQEVRDLIQNTEWSLKHQNRWLN